MVRVRSLATERRQGFHATRDVLVAMDSGEACGKRDHAAAEAAPPCASCGARFGTFCDCDRAAEDAGLKWAEEGETESRW